jgi:ATP/maltotriose-dependent transcriptional regulator MalT
MPVSLNLGYLAGLDHVIAGRFSKAAEWYGDTRVLADIARDPAVAGIADAGSLLVMTWRGDPNEARELIDRCARDAMAAEFGRYYTLTRYSLAVLENSLGRYKAALIAAQDAYEGRALYLATFALPELIEAAARSYDRRTAASALDELAARTIPSGTDWGLGMLARSRALLADDAEAESLYREAIERLAESRALPQLARAHLLYGEWLRRQRRRRNAREHLRRAEGMFVAMGAKTFATRTRHELEATGEHVGPREQPPTEVLTPQEARIADLVATGASNPEIGAQLFISPRTVEYHLHKIFGKLGVSSRVELTRVLMEE